MYICLPHTVYGKTFAVVHKIHYSLENFCSVSGCGHHILYTASDSRGKLLRSAEKSRILRKFSHSKVLPYTVNHSFISVFHSNLGQRFSYAYSIVMHRYQFLSTNPIPILFTQKWPIPIRY